MLGYVESKVQDRIKGGPIYMKYEEERDKKAKEEAELKEKLDK